MNSQKRGASRREYSTNDIEILSVLAREEARNSFWAFRQYMRPELVKGWWIREVSREMQAFYDRLVSGENPTLLVQAAPQHGKSWAVIDFIAWCAGKSPDLRTIFASFSDRLGVRANLALQRITRSPKYCAVFPHMQPPEKSTAVRNREMIEYPGSEGYFRNTTCLGPITGESLDLGIIDDPIKGRKEANSPTVRDSTWAWLTDDFLSRFSKRAGLLMVMTRWHVDDPAGRLIEQGWPVRVVSFPAIATEDEPHRKAGEPLFPELKPLDFLLERQAIMTEASWEALYQQRPFVQGGGMFPVERFGIIESLPPAREIRATVRFWDKAGTADGGARTAGVLMHETRDGRIIVSDVTTGQWSALDRERRIRQCAEIDGKLVKIYVEQEPGSGGKESAESTIRGLAGWMVYADRVTGDKETRAEPYAAQVQGGNVYLVRGPWNKLFIDEHETFPAGKYKDQVDAAAGAFAKLAAKQGLDMHALTRM